MQWHFQKLPPLVAKTLSITGVLASILLIAVLYVALIGVSFDASGQRGKVAALLTENIGRDVRFEGPMQFELSARPKLRVGGLHIANAAGMAGEFASMGEARLALDLWPLLRLRFQVEELSGSDVRIRLQVNKNGGANWMFSSSKPKQAATEQAASMNLQGILALLDIKRVSLENLDVEFIGADEKSHFFELQSLVAHFPAGQPVALTLHGTIEKTLPYQIDFTGGTIADLARLDQPWPVDLKLEFMSSRMTLNGGVSGSTGQINFGLGTENLREFEQLFQTRLPVVGVAGISGNIKYAPGKIALENLSGVMGKTLLNGTLNIDYGGERPSVKGDLALPVLDLRPFLTAQPVTRDEPPKSIAEAYREIAKATFDLKELNSVDADLTLRVGQWLNLPGAVHDAMMQVKLAEGRISIPVQVTVADVKLSGNASADASVTPARFKLGLGARDSGLGNLAGLLFGIPGVKGQLGRFDLRIAARGNRGSELMESLDVRLNVARGKLTYGNSEGERPVEFSLDSLVVALPAGKPLRADTRGSLLGKTFSATLLGSSLAAAARGEAVPVDFELQAGSASARVHAVLQRIADESVSDVAFGLAAPHSGEIASWLGLKPGADAPVNVQGDFHADSSSWHLSGFSLKLGRSDLSADVLRTGGNSGQLIKLTINGNLIDAEQLQSMLPEANEKAPASKPAAANMIDIPILPSGINLADSDIVVRIRQIASTSPFAVRDLRFDGNVRNGMMNASPFSVDVGENNFRGAIVLDLRTQQPHSVLWLSADALNIGSMLKKLGIASNIDAGIGHLILQLDLHSSRLGQLLAQSEMAANLEGGHLTLTDANSGKKMVIALDRGELKSAAGAPVNLSLFGSLDNVPVFIDINTARAVDLINPDLPVPFKFNASTSGAAIQLSGEIERPFSSKEIELSLDMSGSRFDNLDSLVHTSLPPWGPWSASGKFRMASSGYEVSSLQLQMGSSQLTGNGKVDTLIVPPRIDIALTAPAIQLDDFRFGDWSPEKEKPAAAEKPKSQTALRQQASKVSGQAQQLLSREVLVRQSAYLTVRVDQVVSGQDMLGSGNLEARLEDGRAVVGPAVVNTPGGKASFRLSYEPGEKDVAVNLRAEARHFDYGILARRMDHRSGMSGVFSLDVDVNSRAQYLSDIFRYGNGHVDFAVWPENLKSGLLDIWAVNVLMALLPVIDSSSESKVNCAVARFALNDGKLSGKSILIDTSRMRVSGKGGVDFKAEDIQLYVQPRAKTPQFLSLAIPVEVTGNFENFNVGVRPEDVVGTVGQFATSAIWVPIKRLFGKEPPADGRDVCVELK